MKKREREEGNAPYHQHNNAMSEPERGQKRQREEAMREEAAAEEKLKGRSKGGLAQSKSVKPVVSKSGLDGSASMPS